MTTLQEAAMRKALELGKKYAKCLMMNQAPFDEALAALAQQGEPVAYLVYANGSRRYSTLTFDVNKVPEIYIGGEAIPLYTAAPAPQAQDGTFINEGTNSAPQPAQGVPETNFGNMPKIGCVQHDCGECKARAAQPVAPLTDDEILTIAHRKATRYTHAVAPGQVTYGFSVAHLLDFAHGIREVK